ncbi:MAG: PilZ domain-containing protein [Rhodopirellula sp.]|nr:PilZ domain-containing protein [Rhodopirellula sp.]
MIAEPIERRSSKRFTVEADRAEVAVELDGADHRAIMSDISATGFGLLLLKGAHVSPGNRVQLTDPETGTVFDLEVVHLRPEESFQYVGFRRVSDRTPMSIPLFRLAGKTYRLTMPGTSPLVFVGVVLGFSGSSIAMLEIINSAGSPGKQAPDSVHRQTIIAASQRVSAEEKRQRLLERSQRNRTSSVVRSQDLELTPSFWERIIGPNREQVGRLVGGRSISWSELVAQLNLSKAQQDRIQSVLNSREPSKVEAARSQMMTLLTAEQRSTFNQMLATLPLN